MVENVDRDERIEPPIQTENFLSAGALMLILIFDGASLTISASSLSGIPGNIVVPPDITMFSYKSLLTSISHFRTELNAN